MQSCRAIDPQGLLLPSYPNWAFQKTLEREAQQCQALVIWTDCDREGENIGFEVIHVCKAGEYLRPQWVVLSPGPPARLTRRVSGLGPHSPGLVACLAQAVRYLDIK